MTLSIDPLPELLIGPPGTGKTTRLIEIIRQELDRGTRPHEIGLVTFTRQAANEAADRVSKEFGTERADFVNFRTIHSMCARWTGITGKNLLEGEKLEGFAEWIGEEIRGRVAVDGVWENYARGDRLLFMDNLSRIRRIPLRQLYEQDHDDLDWAVVERFSRGLREYKRDNRLHDFSDMLEHFVRERKKPDLRVLLVDEGQDLSLLQWDVVALLAEGCERVVVAGDDDQAIFEWSGAAVETIVEMQGRVTVLGQSYRVPRKIQSVALSVINRVRHRREKHWRPRDDEGTLRHIRSMEEANFDGPSVMVLSRNRYHLDPVERELRASGVLYSREGTMSVKRSLLDAIVVWERLRRGERQRAADVADGPYSLISIGQGLARGFKQLKQFHPDDEVSLSDLCERGGLRTTAVWHEALDKIPAENRLYLQKCRRNGERLTQEPRVRISTIHGSKGGEADRIILMTDIAPRTWREMRVNPDAENRVLYVGVSRAREELCVVPSRFKEHYEI